MSRGGSKSLQKASLCHEKKSTRFTLMGAEYEVKSGDTVINPSIVSGKKVSKTEKAQQKAGLCHEKSAAFTLIGAEYG